jgi:hypothetical protein
VTAFDGLDTIDLTSPARGAGAPLRFAPSPRALTIEPEIGMFLNIQDTKALRPTSFISQLGVLSRSVFFRMQLPRCEMNQARLRAFVFNPRPKSATDSPSPAN